MLIGMAKKEMKFMIDIQLPIPADYLAMSRLPYFAIIFSLICTSMTFVRKQNRGARGNETAKKAMKPS